MTKRSMAGWNRSAAKVNERLDEASKTNETFASVMARLAVIDEAQIDGLTTSVVSLQQVLSDKISARCLW